MSTSFSLIGLRTVSRFTPLSDCQPPAAKTSLLLNNISALPHTVHLPKVLSTHLTWKFSQDVRSGSVLYGGLPLSVSHQQCKQVYPDFSHQLCASILQNNNTNTIKSTITMKGFGKQHCKEVNPNFLCLHIINDK